MSQATPSATPTAAARRPAPVLRTVLRLAGALVILATVAFWAARGAHRGWSQNRVPVAQTDEITGLEYTSYEERYVPGVDFLALGFGAGLALAAASFLFRQKHPNTSK